MKIRILAIIYIIVLVITGAFLYRRIEDREVYDIDMLALNSKSYEISQALDAGSDPKALEEEYDCDIVLCSEGQYEAENNMFIREGYSVFDYVNDGAISGKIAFAAREEEYISREKNEKKILVSILFAALLLGLGILFVVWYFFVRPFNDLKVFAEHVSKGNLDLPLKMRKHNYFGAFTESFDRMREELKKASEREIEASRSKKELVAELSHDIKTPVATIQATCEVMEVKYKDKDPDILEKVEVIKAKASSVDRLIDNMFKATLDELEELKVEQTEESSKVLADIISELRFYGTVETKNEVPECLVYADRLRLEQVIDNIAGNSFKYAGTPLEIEFSDDAENLHVLFMDRGPGVPEEEISLLTSKFYRGSLAAGKDGSGLGLYLAAVFMERMGGGLEVRNRDGGGFVVEIVLKKV
ncbi:MAG: HAMP domain-containing histidine kinase [Clostridiales bacterium]|nr:HAMP domain-containing histidine kinase [Clostridiales bacterium]